MDTYVSSSELAKVLRLTAQRVNQLAKEGTIKREADGKFNISDAVEDYYAYKFKTDEELSYEKERTRHEKAKREKAEIELELLRDSLLYATDVEQAMSGMILTCRSRLLSIPTKCATQVIGQKDLSVIVETIRREIYDALDELKEMPAPRMDEDNAVDS